MPAYEWTCHACEKTNPAHSNSCVDCGCPAEASAKVIDAHRVALRGAPPDEAVVDAQEASSEPQYGGFWRRFGAFWIDFLIWLPLMFVLNYAADSSRYFNVYWFIPGVLLGLWYAVYLVVRYGGTPGKLLLKLRIVMTDGSPVTGRAAILRHSVEFVLATISSIALLWASLKLTDAQYYSGGFMARSEHIMNAAPSWYLTVEILMQVWVWSEFIVMMTNKKRRAIHDFMAGTVVIKVRADKPKSS